MSEDVSQTPDGSSSLRKLVPGFDMLASFAQNAEMRAEALIQASSREADTDWDDTSTFGGNFAAAFSKVPWAIDSASLDRVNAGLAAFRGRIEALESRVEQGQETVSHLAHGSTVSGSHTPSKPVERSSAGQDRLFSEEDDPASSDSVSVVKETGDKQPPVQAPHREWLANALTVAAVLAIVLIALVLISTVL